MSRPAHAEEPAVEAQDVSRFFHSNALLYAPATSVFGRFRRSDRAIGFEAVIGDDDDGDDDDFDDDDEIEELEEELPVPEEQETRGVWALRHISFSLAPGRSLGVIGPRSAGRSTLIRVLGGVIPPTAGRVVLRGRVAPTIEFASTFARVDLDVVGNAKVFSKLTRIPRAERDDYVANLGNLVFGEGRTKLPAALDTRQATRRIAVGVALDPSSDVVLLDELGLAGDLNFHERVLERLDFLRQQGTSVVLATQDISLVRRFCDDALALEDGELTAFGPAEDVILEHRRRRTASPKRRKQQPSVHSFSTEAAILSVDTATADGVPAVTFGDGDVVVRIELETAEPGTFVLSSVAFRRGSGGVIARESDPSLLPDAGRYLISARVPVDALGAGRYHVDVEADVDHDEGRSMIGRHGVRSFEISGAPSAEPGGDLLPIAADWLVEPLQ
jgi:lipopolysaccharide transport system ATP-binding protein